MIQTRALRGSDGGAGSGETKDKRSMSLLSSVCPSERCEQKGDSPARATSSTWRAYEKGSKYAK